MTTQKLLLKFAILIKSDRHPSLLFHRWFPDSESDSISLRTGSAFARLNPKLRVWFDRKEHHYAAISGDRLTDEEISEAGLIAAGPLRGSLELSSDGYLAKEISAVIRDKKGKDYELVAKKVVKLIDEQLQKFTSLLRLKYGQYWIREFPSWDSREQPLIIYCKMLNLRWSTDGDTWTNFLPSDGPAVYAITIRTTNHSEYRAYIEESDWAAIAGEIVEYEPPLAAKILSRAHQAADDNDFSVAFLFAVTALEQTLKQLFTKIKFNRRDQYDLQGQLLVAATLSEGIDKRLLQQSVRAISLRNAVVHLKEEKGKEATSDSDSKACLYALLKVTSILLSGSQFKFPSVHHGNLRMPKEQWP